MNRSILALSAAATLLPAFQTSAQPARVEQLGEIVVEGEASGQAGSGAGGVVGNAGYVPRTTRTATKTETPVSETPQTITTVTQSQLQERRPQTLTDALGYTPGVRTGGYGFDPRFDSFTIRGVDITYTGVFRDGLRNFNSPSGLFRLEPYGVEAISILKGPASSLYGASASVGIIDVISKRPTETRFGEVEIQGGSFDRRQVNFDLGGPANQAGTVLYRITGLLRTSETNLPGVPDDRVFIAPAITFKPSEDTKLTVLGEFMDSKTGGSTAYDNSYGRFTLKDGTVIFPTVGARKSILFNPAYNDFTQQAGPDRLRVRAQILGLGLDPPEPARLDALDRREVRHHELCRPGEGGARCGLRRHLSQDQAAHRPDRPHPADRAGYRPLVLQFAHRVQFRRHLRPGHARSDKAAADADRGLYPGRDEGRSLAPAAQRPP